MLENRFDLNNNTHISDINVPLEHLISAYKNSPLAVFICDKYGNILFKNGSSEVLIDNKLELNQTIWNNHIPFYYKNGKPVLDINSPSQRALELKATIPVEEIVCKSINNEIKEYLVTTELFFDELENPKYILHTFIHVPEYKFVHENRTLLSAIVESSEDAIISLDLKGIITTWNTGAKKMFGYDEEEIIGKQINILIPSAVLTDEYEMFKLLEKGESIDHFQTKRLTKSGQEISVSIALSPIKDHLGNVVGTSKIGRDFSGLLRNQEQLKKYSEHLEILNSIGKIISKKLDVQLILQEVTDATTRLTNAQFGAFFYNTKDDTGKVMTLFNLSGAPREAFEKLGMPRHTNLFYPTFDDNKIVRVADVTKDSKYGNNCPYYGLPKGHIHVVSYLAIPVVSSSGEALGGLLFGHSLADQFTEEHEEIVSSIASQAAIALDNSRLFEEVKAFSDKKDEFIALASHELKTPLTTIKGYLQLLSKKKNQEDITEIFIEKSISQVEKLSALVADLLNVSKIEAGKLVFNLETFDLRTLLLEVIDTLQYTMKSHEVLITDLCEGKELLVNADKQRVEQVIVNLLINAIKYSPKSDKVYIELSIDDSLIKVKVRDEGIGLTPEQQSKIFTRFYRADGVNNISGLGLGLYLSKEIIKRHQGDVFVKSKFGVGSEFSFTIPLL